MEKSYILDQTHYEEQSDKSNLVQIVGELDEALVAAIFDLYLEIKRGLTKTKTKTKTHQN